MQRSREPHLRGPWGVGEDVDMACHDEVTGEGVVGVTIKIMVEEGCLRLSRVHIILELHTGMVQADVMKPAHKPLRKLECCTDKLRSCQQHF